MRRVAWLIACLLAATGAKGGPWPRDKGAVFLSFGTTIEPGGADDAPAYGTPTLYFEYGVTDRLTFGMDGFISNEGQDYTGLVFLRHPIADPGRRDPIAATLAAGYRVEDGRLPEPVIGAGLSWGRGLDRGWLSVDALLTRGISLDPGQAPGTSRKVDVTIGRRFADGWSGILQLQTGRGTSGDGYAKLAPSVVRRAGKRISLELGLVRPLTDHGEGLGLRSGLWLEF